MLRKAALLAYLILAFAAVSAALLTAHYRIPNTAHVKTVGIGCSVTSIDWGFIEPGQNKTSQAQIFNTGNTPITVNMTVENWSPNTAAQYITCGWNLEGAVLQPNETRTATFWLHVSPNCTGITAFSFDVVITGAAV